jgi:hypothetical protein
MTATQRAAISTPATGLQVYQTDGAKGVYAYDGSNWMLNSEWYSNSATSPSVFALSKPGNLNSTGASANIGIGSGTLAGITTGDNNVALGVNALNDVVTSGNSTAVGFGSLSNSTGTGNTAIGFTSGTTNLSGSNNTFIGNQANASLTDLVNATAIGSGAEVSADNTIQLGNNSVINVNTAGGITAGGAVGIGTTSPNPNAALDITSTTQGFLPPRMTNSQINSIYNPVEGLMVYNSTYGHLEVFQKTYGLANKIIDQIPNPLGSYSITGGHGAWQEFTPTVSGLLDSIVLFQSNPLPNPTTTFKYEMRIFSGVTSASGYTLYGGTLLTSANTFLPANNLDARRAYHFQSPIYLTSGVKYWFQITGYCNPCNTDTGFNSTDTYPGNDGFIGGSTKDLFFQVYMREDTGLNWKSL